MGGSAVSLGAKVSLNSSAHLLALPNGLGFDRRCDSPTCDGQEGLATVCARFRDGYSHPLSRGAKPGMARRNNRERQHNWRPVPARNSIAAGNGLGDKIHGSCGDTPGEIRCKGTAVRVKRPTRGAPQRP